MKVATFSQFSISSPSAVSFGRYSSLSVVSVPGSRSSFSGAPFATVTLFTVVPLASSFSSSVWLPKSSTVESWRLLLALVCPFRFTSLSWPQPPVTSHHVVTDASEPSATLKSSFLSAAQLFSSSPFSRWFAAPLMSSSIILEAPNSSIGSFSARLPVTLSVPCSPRSSLPVSPSI